MPTGDSPAEPAKSRSVYRVSPFRLWFTTAMLLFFALLFGVGGLLNIGADPATTKSLFVATLFLAVLAALGYWMSWYPHIVVSEEGFELHQSGIHLSTPWGNVERVWVKPGHKRVGLVLYEPLTGKGALRLRRFRNVGTPNTGAKLYDSSQIALIEEGRLIPIDPFGYLLKKGILQEELKRYAPRLIDGL